MSRQNEIKPTSRDYSFFYTYVRSYILHEPKKPIMELYVLICSVHNVDFTIKRFYQFQTQYHKWASIQEIDISKPHLFYQIQILSYTTRKIFKLIKHLMHFCKVKSYYASSQEGETNYAAIFYFLLDYKNSFSRSVLSITTTQRCVTAPTSCRSFQIQQIPYLIMT